MGPLMGVLPYGGVVCPSVMGCLAAVPVCACLSLCATGLLFQSVPGVCMSVPGVMCPLNAMSGLVGMLAGITMGNHGMHAGAHMGAHGVRAGVPVGCHDVHTGAPLGGHGCTRAWHSLKPLFLPKRG